MKKFAASLLALTLLISLSGCELKSDTPKYIEDGVENEELPLNEEEVEVELESDDDDDAPTESQDLPVGSEEVAAPSVVNVTVSGTEFTFSPSTIQAKVGDVVKVTFVNNGAGSHDFDIDEFNVDTAVIGGGVSSVAEFVVDKAGSFNYYCSVGSHRQLGMVGTLVVSE